MTTHNHTTLPLTTELSTVAKSVQVAHSHSPFPLKELGITRSIEQRSKLRGRVTVGPETTDPARRIQSQRGHLRTDKFNFVTKERTIGIPCPVFTQVVDVSDGDEFQISSIQIMTMMAPQTLLTTMTITTDCWTCGMQTMITMGSPTPVCK